MAPLSELLPPWRDTVTRTTTVYQEIPTTDNSNMNVKEITVAKAVLPKHGIDKFDSVARLGLGRALMIKNPDPSIAETAAIRALDKDIDAKKTRMLHLTSWVSELRALRAAEKEKNRAHNAAEKEKDRAYRAERFHALIKQVNTFCALRAAEKEKNRAHRAAEKEKDRAHRAAEKEKDRAHRAAEKEKDRAHHAAENEKDRAYRAHRFNTFMAYRTASQVQRAVRRTPVAKPVAALSISAMACSLAAYFAASRTNPKAADNSASR